MESYLTRTEMMLGKKAIDKLQKSRVLVFGVGGVGGYVIEALTRSGIGTIGIVDHDTVSESNLNRQIIATRETIGKYKTDVMEQRMKSINPDIVVKNYNCFYLPETRDTFSFSEYDYIVDAIDTITAKIDLVIQAEKYKVPLISSMGTGNKLDPMAFEVADIYNTSVCPLAKVMRKELKQRNIKSLKVVYSKEQPQKSKCIPNTKENGRPVPGSVSFVPAAAGLLLASEVIKDLIKDV